MDERILELAYQFAEVHIGDNDELGEMAGELALLIEREVPDIYQRVYGED